MKNLQRWSLLTLVTALLLTTGCTRVMKTANARKSLSQLNGSIDKSLKQMNADIAKKKSLLAFLKKDGVPPKKPPMPALNKHMKGMKKSQGKLQKTHKDVRGLQKRFNKLVGKRKKLRSDRQPLWNRVMSLLKEAKKTPPRAKKALKGYETHAKAFHATAKKGRIGKMKVASVKKTIQGGLKKIAQQVKKTRQSIDEAIGWLEAAEKRLGAAEASRRRRILEKMTGILPKIVAEAKKADEIYADFKKKAGKKKEIWVGPGSKTGKITGALEAQLTQINKLSRQVTQLGKQFKAKPKKKSSKKR
jgi:hypothetical protein